jgi:hypothetical protein
LEGVTQHIVEVARARHALLLAQMAQPDSPLMAHLNRDRRGELARFGQPLSSSIAHETMHLASLGLYTQRVRKSRLDLAQLDRERRFAFHLDYLDGAVRNGTPPEVANSALQIQASLAALRELIDTIDKPLLRAHALATVSRVAELSHDDAILAGCRSTLLAFIPNASADSQAAERTLGAPVAPSSGITGVSGLSHLR